MKISMLDGPGAPSSVVQKVPSPSQRIIERAHDAKVSATDAWVRGHMSSKEHDAVHKRADRVIKKKGKK